MIVVPISKVIGLYDRDDLVLRKSTLDESPALFQLATLYALGFWLLAGTLVRGRAGQRPGPRACGALLFAFALVGRWVARKAADAPRGDRALPRRGRPRRRGRIGRSSSGRPDQRRRRRPSCRWTWTATAPRRCTGSEQAIRRTTPTA